MEKLPKRIDAAVWPREGYRGVLNSPIPRRLAAGELYLSQKILKKCFFPLPTCRIINVIRSLLSCLEKDQKVTFDPCLVVK
jgi:hypothetical protein